MSELQPVTRAEIVSPNRRRWISAVLATTSLFALQNSAPDPRPDLPPETKIVAMGDSYTSGHADGQVDGIYEDCFRHEVSYANQIASQLDIVDFSNVACSGASPEEVINGRFGQASQLESLDEATDYVLMTTGANVTNLSDLLEICMTSDCNTDNRDIAAVFESLRSDDFRNRLTSTYQAVLEAAPSASLIVVGYPSVIDTGAFCGTLVREDVDDFVMKFVAGLNGAIAGAVESVAKEGSAIYYSEPPSDIDICRSLGRAFHHDLDNPRAIGHPTAMGHQAMADSVLRTMAGVRQTELAALDRRSEMMAAED